MATPATQRFAPILAILAAAALLLSIVALAGPVRAASGDVEESKGSLNSCQQTDPDGTTTKDVTGGTLTQGGTATFTVTYEPLPGNEDDEFNISDCLFVGDVAVAAWDVTAVKGDGSVTFTVDLPSGDELAAIDEEEESATATATEYCNYVTFQGNNSASACFVLAGDADVFKTDANEQALAGATFTVDCTPPATEDANAFIPFELSSADATANADGSWSTGASGAFHIHAGIGSVCTVTETSAPSGYNIATPASADVTIDWQPTAWTFVNAAIPSAPSSAAGGQQGAGASTAPNTALFESVPGGSAAIVVAAGVFLGSLVSLALIARRSGWRRFDDA